MYDTKKIKEFPDSSGCYIMHDSDGEIIYIGKAKNIKKRVSSYFAKKHEDYKTQELVKNIDAIDFVVTHNEIESLLLEAQMIREHRPKYNIDLKDNRRYSYLQVTHEKYPRIITARKSDQNGKYFGPFTSGKARAIANQLSNRLFKIRVCPKLPKKACLLYHLGQCTAPCIDKVSEKEYSLQIKKAILFLKGENTQLIQILEKEMKIYSKKLNFERAQELKEQIRTIKILSERQNVELPKNYDQNVLNYLVIGDQIHIQLFQVQKGVITGRKEFITAEIKDAISAFIKQYYFENSIPQEIIIPKKLMDHSAIESYLSTIHHSEVKLTVPQIGYKKQLLEMVRKNIEMKISSEPLMDLKQKLGLNELPTEIDCFDISNISGKFSTGSCVRFSNGVPNKQWYRHFKIKTISGVNDFAMIHEVVLRRYSRQINIPNLIMIDGGKGQLSSAKSALSSLNINTELISLAKKEEIIFNSNNPEGIHLSHDTYSLQLLQKIRDEAHRFAVSYHKKLRSRGMLN